MHLILRKLKTASAFSLAQWRILGEAYFLFLKVRFLLFFLPSSSVGKGLVQAHPNSPLKQIPRPALKELRQGLRIAARYQWGKPRCLAISLTEKALLSRYDFSAQIRIGVRKEEGQLRAHAWCEDPGRANRQLPKNPFHVLEHFSPQSAREGDG